MTESHRIIFASMFQIFFGNFSRNASSWRLSIEMPEHLRYCILLNIVSGHNASHLILSSQIFWNIFHAQFDCTRVFQSKCSIRISSENSSNLLTADQKLNRTTKKKMALIWFCLTILQSNVRSTLIHQLVSTMNGFYEWKSTNRVVFITLYFHWVWGGKNVFSYQFDIVASGNIQYWIQCSAN